MFRDPQNLAECEMNLDMYCTVPGCEFEGEVDGILIAYGMDWHSFEWTCPACENTTEAEMDNDGCHD